MGLANGERYSIDAETNDTIDLYELHTSISPILQKLEIIVEGRINSLKPISTGNHATHGIFRNFI